MWIIIFLGEKCDDRNSGKWNLSVQFSTVLITIYIQEKWKKRNEYTYRILNYFEFGGDGVVINVVGLIHI